ncbi:MAG: M20 family metallopeptidase [Victivallaceae bacterium]|nr:M20 family metallopeptidase [Victivallaceae bacterium]
MFVSAVKAAIAAHQEELRLIAAKIFASPELGFKEHRASRLIADCLKAAGFELQHPYCGLETAFRASYGRGKGVFCVMCEYDALPEIGHACGHHLIAAAGLAAGLAVKQILAARGLPGTIVVLGTPAEEGEGGKIELLRAGAFADIDGCILCHPYCQTGIDPGELAVSRFNVEFHGRAAHAASAPEQGINALDAMNLLFAGINAWRQQLPETSRVHGIVTAGGAAANIIPAYTAANFYLRSLTNENCAAMEARFNKIAEGAALMTGCSWKVSKLPRSYLANRPNPALDAFVAVRLAAAGMKPEPITGRVSTDYGNVSQVVPGCNFFFSVCKTKSAAALHSAEFKTLSAAPYAFEQCLKAGGIMALTALEFLQNKLELNRER